MGFRIHNIHRMDVRALTLGARFSYPPNHRGYCGRESAQDVFTRCILHGSCDKVGEELTRFIVLYPYLQVIAEAHDLDPFDRRVIEAYWIGNRLLEKIDLNSYDRLLDRFMEQGVPEWLIRSLRERRPARFIPTHLFQVLHVGVGQASGAVPFTMESVYACMIRWGKVEHVDHGGALSLKLNSIRIERGAFGLFHEKVMVAPDAHPFDEIHVGDTVAVHWNKIVKVLTPPEQRNLTRWTRETLQILQPLIPAQ